MTANHFLAMGLVLSVMATGCDRGVYLWERTLCEEKPMILERGPFADYDGCMAWAAEHPKGTFGRHCGTKGDMNGQWREGGPCPK